jgi:hypothetical protein
MLEEEAHKKIVISGINNCYQIKKLIKPKNVNENKKRVESEKWTFDESYYEYSSQLKILIDLSNNLNNEVSKIVVQEINKKINGYKQQDKLKKILDENKFLTFKTVLQKLIEYELKCHYCKTELKILYDISRQMTQWSVDRIDNDKGHNSDNFYIACLDCNLKRRRRSDDKFLFTKQMKLVKVDNDNNDKSNNNNNNNNNSSLD